MLTAKGTQADVIQGLTLGADDYIKKPFDMEELALRVEAVLRRARAARQTLTRTPAPSSTMAGCGST